MRLKFSVIQIYLLPSKRTVGWQVNLLPLRKTQNAHCIYVKLQSIMTYLAIVASIV